MTWGFSGKLLGDPLIPPFLHRISQTSNIRGQLTDVDIFCKIILIFEINMQTLTEKIWSLRTPGGIFDDAIVRIQFPNSSDAARRNLLLRATKSGEAFIIRRGLYVLAEPYRGTALDPSILTHLIYSPSHLSFESALRFYGLIPDIVQTNSAATSRRSCVFATELGHFTYTSIPVQVLMAGVRMLSFEVEGLSLSGFVASPARAIADLIYVNKGITWQQHGLSYLEESLRMDIDSLVDSLSQNEMNATLESYRNLRVRSYMSELNLWLRSYKKQQGRKGKQR
jgi:hypothetical protein